MAAAMGFLDQVHPAGAGAFGGFLDGPALHRGGARRHADDDHRAGEAAPVVDLADEVLDHLLGDLEIGDDAFAQGTDGLDVARRAAEHLLGFVADGENLFLALDLERGDHGRLVENDPPALDVD